MAKLANMTYFKQNKSLNLEAWIAYVSAQNIKKNAEYKSVIELF